MSHEILLLHVWSLPKARLVLNKLIRLIVKQFLVQILIYDHVKLLIIVLPLLRIIFDHLGISPLGHFILVVWLKPMSVLNKTFLILGWHRQHARIVRRIWTGTPIIRVGWVKIRLEIGSPLWLLKIICFRHSLRIILNKARFG